MKCPTCKGDKQIAGHAYAPDASGFNQAGFGVIDCFRCNATGEVPDEQKAWIAFGQNKIGERRSRSCTLRMEAIRLGIDALLLSQAEQGMIDPVTVWPPSPKPSEAAA